MIPSSTSTTTTSTYDRSSQEIGRSEIDWILGCSPGCTLTAHEVEQYLAVSYVIIPGSLKFKDDAWTDNSNDALFTVRLRDGGSILGAVTIKAVIEATKVTAYSDIRVINVIKVSPAST